MTLYVHENMPASMHTNSMHAVIYMYVGSCLCRYVSMNIVRHALVCACVFICIHIDRHTGVCLYVCMSPCIMLYAYRNIYMYSDMHKYECAYTESEIL